MRPRALDLVAESLDGLGVDASGGSTEKVHVAGCGSCQIHGRPPLPTNQPIHAFLSSPIPWLEPPPVTWAPGCSKRGGVRPCAMALLTCDYDLQQLYVVARGTGVWQRCSSGAAPTTLLCNGSTPSSSPTALLQACSVVGNQGRKGLGNYNK